MCLRRVDADDLTATPRIRHIRRARCDRDTGAVPIGEIGILEGVVVIKVVGRRNGRPAAVGQLPLRTRILAGKDDVLRVHGTDHLTIRGHRHPAANDVVKVRVCDKHWRILVAVEAHVAEVRVDDAHLLETIVVQEVDTAEVRIFDLGPREVVPLVEDRLVDVRIDPLRVRKIVTGEIAI